MAAGFGCPALNVKPVDWKGVETILGSFFAPFVALALFVLNIIIMKNYFFNYIKKYISEGYGVKDGYFAQVTYDVTIGEMMQTLCSDSKWEYTPDTESGLVFVTYTREVKILTGT